MVMLYTSPPNSPREGNAQVTIFLSNTEKSISSCTGRSAVYFTRKVDEIISVMCSVTQCRRANQEQPSKFLRSFKKARKGTSWCSGTDVLLSAGHWCCCTVWCNFQRIVLILQSFTSLKILTKNSHNKENLRLNNKVWKWQLKPSYAPVPEYTITRVSNREQGGAGYSKWVSYGGALSDSLRRLDGMHSTRHVAAQQTMSTKIKPEQLPHLLSTSILCIEQAWVPVWRKKTPFDSFSYIYIHTACGYINIGCFIRLGYVLDSRQI